jgi:hypothetical protein
MRKRIFNSRLLAISSYVSIRSHTYARGTILPFLDAGFDAEYSPSARAAL